MATYTVYQNKFHGGIEISRHRSMAAALKKVIAHRCVECRCGGPTIEADDDTDISGLLIAYDYYNLYCKEPIADAIRHAVGDYGSFSS